MHEAEVYHQIRRYVFATYHKYDYKKAEEVLLSNTLSNPKHKIGLLAELFFYHNYREQFNLVVAFDCGDCTDFVGIDKGQLIRFDVTSNINFKRLELFTRVVNSINYRIPIYNSTTNKVDDIIEVIHPGTDTDANNELIIGIVKEGELYRYNGYLEIYRLTVKDTDNEIEYLSLKRIDTNTSYQINYSLPEDDTFFEDGEVNITFADLGRFHTKLMLDLGYPIVALGRIEDHITDPHSGETEERITFDWINPLIKQLNLIGPPDNLINPDDIDDSDLFF